MSDLPYVDTHSTEVDAPAPAVWEAVERVMGVGVAKPFARVLGCVDPGGFHIARDERPTLLSLEGEHRFARYELRFVLEQGLLRAETRAVFPGVKGTVYRALVIGSRGHVLATRGLLRAIKRRAEGSPSGQAVRSV